MQSVFPLDSRKLRDFCKITPVKNGSLSKALGSNSNRKDEEAQNRLLLVIAGVWLLCFLALVMWARHIVFG